MNHCSYCEKLKKELKKLPSKYVKPVEIENLNLSHADRETIYLFPTMEFFSDDGRILKILGGFHPISEIISAYEKVKELEQMQSKFKKTEEI
jgi:thioredoxin-related protein